MSRVLPILFNTDMVRAILDGRKTVTRRLVKPANPFRNKEGYCQGNGLWIDGYRKDDEPNGHIKDYSVSPCWWPKRIYIEKYAPYQPEDIMYVRETVWQKVGYYLDVDGETKPSWYKEFKYAATDEKPETGWNYSWAKRPSIHMPKEAARIWLKVNDVRVERLKDITEEQAKAEGIREYSKDGKLWKYAVTDDWWISYHHKYRKFFVGSWWQDMPRTAKEAFHHLWNSTLGRRDTPEWYANNWSGNPWVWVIEFERCEKPEGW